MAETTWSLGVLIWLPIASVLLLICLAVIAWGILREQQDDLPSYDDGMGWFGIVGGGLVALLLIGGTAWGMYPYKAEYHQWRPVSGEVDQIAARVVSGGDGIEQKYVARFVGDQQEYGIQDTRAALIEPGDVIALQCKRAWMYAGNDGYDCRFVANDGPRGEQ